MAGTLKTYFDFAENDYNFLKASVENGIVANHMGALSQEICEKYMKHIIDKYCTYTDKQELSEYNFAIEKKDILRTHNLNKLINFIEEYCTCQYSEKLSFSMLQINGYYFSTRYPGDDSFQLRDKDIKRAFDIVTGCRAETIEIENNFLQQKIENINNKFDYSNKIDEDLDEYDER